MVSCLQNTVRHSLFFVSAASRRITAFSGFQRLPFCSQANTREQRFLMRHRRQVPQTNPVVKKTPPVSEAVSNFLALQREAEGVQEAKEAAWQSVSPLFSLEEISATAEEVADAEEEVARHELSRSAITSLTCQGCGVQLQTNVPEAPGFVEPKLASAALSSGASPAESGLVCRRCLVLKYANPSSDRPQLPSMDAANLETVFASIRKLPRATILVVVDMLNVEGSTIPDLYSRLGSHHYVLVGNKVDQLLPDGPAYQTHWRQHLQECALEITGIDESKLVSTLLVSARTGYNIETLITQLLAVRFRRQPTYIVGCTNVGKSSLFNQLLKSDYCKQSSRFETPEATVSSWPGTTAAVLHFPVTTMTTAKQRLRDARLSRDSKLVTRELSNASDPLFLKPLEDHVGKSFSHPTVLVDQHQGFTTMPTYRFQNGSLQDATFTEEMLRERYLSSKGLDAWNFSSQKVCYDTPGDTNVNLLSNYLTPKENAIIQGGGGLRLLPRTFSLRPGLTLLLGGIARLEYCEGPTGLLVTTQTHLPVHITPSEDIEEYLAQFGQHLLVPDVTTAPDVRAIPLPAMASHELTAHLNGIGSPLSEVDVVFSGAGWVAVAPPTGKRRRPDWRRRDLDRLVIDSELHACRFRAHFPHGLSCFLRTPALNPRAVLQRGPREIQLREFRQPSYITDWRSISNFRAKRRRSKETI